LKLCEADIDSVDRTYVGVAFNMSAGPLDEYSQGLRFELLGCNSTEVIFMNEPVLDNEGTMFVGLVPEKVGSADCFFRLKDMGGNLNDAVDLSSVEVIHFVIEAVNQPPSFEIIDTSVHVTELDYFFPGAQNRVLFPKFVQFLDVGPAHEQNQTVSFLVTYNGPFDSSMPAVEILVNGSTGELSVKLSEHMWMHKEIRFNVSAHDTGATNTICDDGSVTRRTRR